MSKWTFESTDLPDPVTRSSVQKIEFLVDRNDFSVSEYFETRAHSLPKIVVVTQGFCGEILDDIFDKDQVFRLQTTSHQKRIIAKASDGHCAYSIPIGYPLHFCVIKKKGKVGKPKALKDIVTKHSFPVDVKFAKDQVFHVGGSKTCANRFPQLTLIDAFDEVYFLANPIENGMKGKAEVHLYETLRASIRSVDFRVVHIPLYLSLLRLAEVTGIKDWSQRMWERYKAELNMLVAQSVEFDRTFGNKDIAIYQQDAFKADTMYSYIEPQTYCNLSSVDRMYEAFDEIPSNVYDEIGNPKRESAILKPLDKASEPAKYISKGKKEEMVTSKCKPDRNVHVAADLRSFKISTECFAPALPRRNPGTKASTPPAIPPRPNLYVNDIPRGTIMPQVQTGPDKMHTPPISIAEKPRQDTFAGAETTVTPTLNAVNETTVAPPLNVRNGNTINSLEKPRGSAEPNPVGFDVAKLTMKGLAECMETLKLSKYVVVFRDNMVDGTLLRDLNTDILQSAFGFNSIEAIRLMRFAKEGHIPK